jgi:hypothetical protein
VGRRDVGRCQDASVAERAVPWEAVRLCGRWVGDGWSCESIGSLKHVLPVAHWTPSAPCSQSVSSPA